MGSSMMVSFGGGFSFSITGGGGTDSMAIGSTSDGEVWLLLACSDAAATAF